MRLGVDGWGREPQSSQWSPELGSDRRLLTEVSLSVLTINEYPEASPCFFVRRYLFSVTVGKTWKAPQCSNSFSPAAIQSMGP